MLEADLLVFPMLVAAARPKRGNHDPDPTLGGPDLDRGWSDLSNGGAEVEGREGSRRKKERGKMMKRKRERHE
jgi:hypothetical protein